MPYIPHTENDVQAMLKTLDVQSIDDLFDEIPESLRIQQLNEQIVPEGMTEMQAKREFAKIAAQDQTKLNFIGAGAYEHHIPAAVWEITSRGEFLTAYTPYQAEASQGTLQLIYEYQTMMASLMGMDVANASLYDGASALAEAVLMAVRVNRKSKSRKILIPGALHPHYRQVVKSIVVQQNIEIIELPYCTGDGNTVVASLQRFANADITALVIPQPNFFGVLEDVDALTNWAHTKDAIVIGMVNPMTTALLKEPGQWGNDGADIACGEGQPLGVPLASGGPYFGFLCCKQALVRQMPGRIVGRTIDMDGKQAFALTLQAREQHIRRSKATSNICTNQGLLVTAATVYMSLLGHQGMQSVAEACHQKTNELVEQLTSIDGVEKVFQPPSFHEVVIRLNVPVESVLTKLAAIGIQGGFALTNDYPELGECLLVCATETKTDDDIHVYKHALQNILSTSPTETKGQMEFNEIQNLIQGSLNAARQKMSAVN